MKHIPFLLILLFSASAYAYVSADEAYAKAAPVNDDDSNISMFERERMILERQVYPENDTAVIDWDYYEDIDAVSSASSLGLSLEEDIAAFWRKVENSVDDDMRMTVDVDDSLETTLETLEGNIESMNWLLDDIIVNGCNFETCDLAGSNMPRLLYLSYLHLAIKVLDRISLQQGYKHYLLDTYREKFLEFHEDLYYAD